MTGRDSVLVLEAGTRASVEVIRSLLRQKLDVVAGADHRFCAGLFVRGLRRRVIYPSPESRGQAFIDWLLGFLQSRRVGVLVPLGEIVVGLISQHQEEIRRHTRLFMPEYRCFNAAYDKILTNKAAEAAAVPLPRSWYPDESGLDGVLKQADYPVLVKPSLGVGARGIVLARGPSELEPAWNAAQSKGRAFVQEFIPPGGRQCVLDMLLDEQLRPVAAVASQKVRFFPVKWGASTLSRSIVEPELCQAALRLLRRIGYYGVANIDWIEDPRDGVAKLLEINPRFGEMHAICNVVGVDLPLLLYRLSRGLPVQPVDSYPSGKYLRCLPTDLMWFLKSPNRFRADPGFFESFRLSMPGAMLSGGDFGPAVGYLLENAALLASPRKFADRFVR